MGKTMYLGQIHGQDAWCMPDGNIVTLPAGEHLRMPDYQCSTRAAVTFPTPIAIRALERHLPGINDSLEEASKGTDPETKDECPSLTF